MESQPAGRFERPFFARSATTLARSLLGQLLVSCHGGHRTAGTIVETEAYLGIEDRAAHTHGGRRTPRNESMWGAPGHAYVYFVYGMHHCMNVVAGRSGEPVAVLLRALAPAEGVEHMRSRRGGRPDRELCSGPARLCQALGITLADDGADLVTGPAVWLERVRGRALPDSRIVVGPRVGIDYAGDWREAPLRFAVRDDPNVSRPRL